MARKNKYSKLKPKVSPLMLVITGLFFIGLILTIALSIDTPKQNFNKRFKLENNKYELINLKTLNKKIENKEELIVIVNVGVKGFEAGSLLSEVHDLYQGKELYKEYDLKDYPKKVYYLEVKELANLKDFFEKYEMKHKTTGPFMYAFSDGELHVEYDGTFQNPELVQEENVEKANLIRNVKKFFNDYKVEI